MPKKVLLVYTTIIITLLIALILLVNKDFLVNSSGAIALDSNTPFIVIEFNYPIAKETITDNIQISPEVEWQSSVSGKNLYIIFKENLSTGKKYTLSFSQGIKNVYQKGLKSQQQIEIKVNPAELVFAQKQGEVINLVKTNKTLTKQETLFSAQDISAFAINKNTLAYTLSTAGYNKLYLYDLNTKSEIALPENKLDATNLLFSRSGNRLFFIGQEYEVSGGIRIYTNDKKIYYYDLNENSLQSIAVNPALSEIYEFSLAANDNTVLAKEAITGYYYTFSLDNPEKLLPLGKFLNSSGFHPRNKTLLFTQYNITSIAHPEIIFVDEIGDEYLLSNKNKFNQSPEFFYNSKKIIYSVKGDLESKYFGAEIRNLNKELLAKINPPAFISLENPLPSFDDNYVVFEAINPDTIQFADDLYQLNGRVYGVTGNLYIYDVKSNKFLDKQINGFAPDGTDKIEQLHAEALSKDQDFYIDPETGFLVSTSQRLRNLGTCCNNGCRHCPWQE